MSFDYITPVGVD